MASAIVITSGGRGLAADVGEVAEPDDYRTEHYRAPVPATLKGAKVIDGAAAEKLWREARKAKGTGAVFIDVYPQAPKPPNLPNSTVWRTPKRTTIADGVWLPNVGYGVLAKPVETYFREGLERLSGGSKSRTLVFYCLRDCWMSWNAAKRALEWGYRDVVWFPDGLDAWQDFDLPSGRVTPQPGLDDANAVAKTAPGGAAVK